MAVNLDSMAKDRASKTKGGEFIKLENGDTVVMVSPPSRGDDDKFPPTAGLPYIEAVYHYGVGKQNMTHLCLDAEKNPIIKHPFVVEILKKNGVKLEDGKQCPTCQKREAGELGEEEAKNCRPQNRFAWGMTPMRHRNGPDKPWNELNPQPGIYQCGRTVWEGIVDVFSEYGDITKPEGAILVKITKAGKPAILEDGVLSEPVSGYAKPTDDGKMTATTVRFGAKVEEKGSEKKKTK